jgi:hypothetical protein
MKTLSRILNVFLIVATGVAITGCSKDIPTYSLLPAGETFKQSNPIINNQIDILWVVDNSGSMGPLQTNMVNNFNSFISDFQNKNYDFRMAVTTSDAYKADPTLNGYVASNSSLSLFRDGVGSNHTGVFVIVPTTPNLTNTFVTNATQGANGSGDERVFSSFRAAMNNKSNPSFLRSNSFFAIIILSDEDDFSGNGRCEGCGTDHNYNASTLDTVATYESFLDTLTQTTGAYRRWNANAITVLDSTCLAQHQSQSPSSIIGARYIQMANDTSGVLGSVCDASYANSLSAIETHIAELSTQFFLGQVPQVNTIVVSVNGVFVPQDPNNGWTYNSAANSIVFHGSAIPAQGATITVDFTPVGLH